MIPGPVEGRIHVTAKPGSELRPGSTVVLHVIKSLDGAGDAVGSSSRKWAVGIGGKVYPAFTDVALEPGATLKARVALVQGKLVLNVSDRMPDRVPDAVRSALQAAGVPAGQDAEIIARALARSGLPLLPETIQKARALLARVGLEARSGARAAATLVDRGFDLAGETARTLLPVLAFGQKGGEDHRRYRGRDLPGSREAVKKFASTLAVDPGGTASALQAYNHTRGASQTWVVIPFVFNVRAKSPQDERPGDRIAGSIRILYDAFASRPVAFSLVTDEISFHLPLQGKRGALSLYCAEALRPAAARSLDSLRAKFHNMGLEVDDTINEKDAFDGFSPVEEGAGFFRVDTVG